MHAILQSAPYSSYVHREEPLHKPLLSVLHLWRVTPSVESLRKIIPPSKGQPPIIMRGSRMSGRKVVMGVWAVLDGEAVTVSVYDAKAVQNLEITFLSGWWAELGIPPLKSMLISGLGGVAVYLVQGITLRAPQPDQRGRVDMSKASLEFNPAPPPPLFEFDPSQFDFSARGEPETDGNERAGGTQGHHGHRVVWRGMRAFRQRAVLLACARNGPSMMLVRGWDSSMQWRMTNVVTFHEEDWKSWNELREPARALTASLFGAGNVSGGRHGATPSSSEEERDGLGSKADEVWRASGNTDSAKNKTAEAVETDPPAGQHGNPSELSRDNSGGTANSGTVGSRGSGADTGADTDAAPHNGHDRPGLLLRNPATTAGAISAADKTRTERLCQAIADRVEVWVEGKGGRIALRAPRRNLQSGANGGGGGGGCHKFFGARAGESKGSAVEGGEDGDDDGDEADVGGGRGGSAGGLLKGGGNAGGGAYDSDGHGTKDMGQGQVLSHKDMEERLRDLDLREDTTASVAMLEGPRRPLEDLNVSANEWLENIPGGKCVKAFARRRLANGKMRSLEEVMEQLAKSAKRQAAIAAARREKAIYKWKMVGKVLCRLLRMSDYWYAFACEGDLLTSEERAARRICVLRQIVQMRGAGRPTLKSLVQAIADMYPHSVWSRFRQLMRQPKAQRMRRDMAVCATLLGAFDNQFFKYTTAGWPFSRLVDLVSDAWLVKKPALSVLYEEGETTPRVIESAFPTSGGEARKTIAKTSPLMPSSKTDPRRSNRSKLADAGAFPRGHSGSRGDSKGTEWAGRSSGTSGGGGRDPKQAARPSPQTRQQEDVDEGVVGAYVIMRGSVDLYLLERGSAAKAPTAEHQDYMARKACRGQPMCGPRPTPEWGASNGTASAASGTRRSAGNGGTERWRRQAVDEPFEAVLSGNGPGPRRARCRNTAPRWKACRLGAGALFGDRPLPGSSSYSSGPVSTSSTPLSPRRPSSGPALETAITAEDTELLEIGVTSYRRLLENGVKERTARAVTVLQSTGAMGGVPIPALARICRYATERVAGRTPADASDTPPLVNPRPGRPVPAAVAQEPESTCTWRKDSENRSQINKSEAVVDDVVCRKGTFRGTVFFVVEGHGNVVLDDEWGGESLRDRGGGGLSTESLLAAAAFGKGHALKNRQKRRQLRRKAHHSRNAKGNKPSCQPQGGSHGKLSGSVSVSTVTKNGTGGVMAVGPAAAAATTPACTVAEKGSAAAAAAAAVVVPERKGSEAFADLSDAAAAAAGIHPTQTVSNASQGQRLWTTQGAPSQTSSPSTAALTISFAGGEREQGGWDSSGSGGRSEEERWPRLRGSAWPVKRGDFFGVDPASPPAEASRKATQSRSMVALSAGEAGTAVDPVPSSTPASGEPALDAAAAAAAATETTAATASPAPPAETTSGAVETSSRRGVSETSDPAAIAAEPSVVPPPTFPSLHLASLVAGPGGMRCFAVGLAVLQKVCPPVHRRLARVASERYSEWMAEARRRNEDEWQESLEHESVQSLSRSFYDSFAKGDYSGSVAGKGATDMGSSVGWTIGDCGGGSSVAGGGESMGALSFGDSTIDSSARGEDGGDDGATIQTAAAPVPTALALRSIPSSPASQAKSLFELSRRFIGLALCSSGRTVVPVRLGRAVAMETMSLAAHSAERNQRGSRARPVPPPPRAVAVSSTDEAMSGRDGRPRGKTAANTAIPCCARRRCFDPASPSYADRDTIEGDCSLPDTRERGGETTVDDDDHPQPSSRCRHSFSHDHAGLDVADAPAEIADSSGGHVRGPPCDTRITHDTNTAAPGRGARKNANLVENYHQIETYDCPVSPFTIPPTWAELPPLTTLAPPAFTSQTRTPAASLAERQGGVEGLGGGSLRIDGRVVDARIGCGKAGRKVVHSREGQSEVDVDNSPGFLAAKPFSSSPQLEDETKAPAVRRPAEKTFVQVGVAGRRATYRWGGWRRLAGNQGRRRRKRGGTGTAVAAEAS